VIVLDIGNGSIKWGSFERDELTESGSLPLDADPHSLPWAILENDEEPGIRGSGNRGPAPPNVAVSVNPPVLERWRSAHPSLRVIGREIPLPLLSGYESCGDDRVCALAGALRDADAAVVIDAGTCLVATVGTRENGVMGGAIVPGPNLMADALAAGTAGLPRVDFRARAAVLGKSTRAAIQAGLDAAHIGATRELITRIRREMGVELGGFGPARQLLIVSTGTGGESLAERIPEIDTFQPYLPLWGALVAARRPPSAESDSAHR
jgi:type III pantothenate kinase